MYNNNGDVLDFMINNPVDIGFKEKENYCNFLEYLTSKNISVINQIYENVHHITFYAIKTGNVYLSRSSLLYGSTPNGIKKLYYYEDLFQNCVVELI